MALLCYENDKQKWQYKVFDDFRLDIFEGEILNDEPERYTKDTLNNWLDENFQGTVYQVIFDLKKYILLTQYLLEEKAQCQGLNKLIKYETFISLTIAYIFYELKEAERRKTKMENRIAKNRTSPKNENNYINAYKELNPKANYSRQRIEKSLILEGGSILIFKRYENIIKIKDSQREKIKLY